MQSETSQVNFLHMLSSRGRRKVVITVLKKFEHMQKHSKSNLTEADFIDLINMKGKNGRGCVDVALKNDTDLAVTLKMFGGVAQTPNPNAKAAKGERSSASGQDKWEKTNWHEQRNDARSSSSAWPDNNRASDWKYKHW